MPKFKPYPDESPSEALERISENIAEEGFPTSDAMLRSENYQLGGQVRPPTAPSITPTPQYKSGGIIKKAVEKYKSKKVEKKREKARKKSVEDFTITSIVQPKAKKKGLKPAIVPSNPPLFEGDTVKEKILNKSFLYQEGKKAGKKGKKK